MASRISALPNGPYLLEDGVLRRSSGESVPVEEKVALCRCGGSKNKPFCDGTHSKIGFDGATAAVEKAEGQG